MIRKGMVSKSPCLTEKINIFLFRNLRIRSINPPHTCYPTKQAPQTAFYKTISLLYSKSVSFPPPFHTVKPDYSSCPCCQAADSAYKQPFFQIIQPLHLIRFPHAFHVGLQFPKLPGPKIKIRPSGGNDIPRKPCAAGSMSPCLLQIEQLPPANILLKITMPLPVRPCCRITASLSRMIYPKDVGWK